VNAPQRRLICWRERRSASCPKEHSKRNDKPPHTCSPNTRRSRRPMVSCVSRLRRRTRRTRSSGRAASIHWVKRQRQSLQATEVEMAVGRQHQRRKSAPIYRTSAASQIQFKNALGQRPCYISETAEDTRRQSTGRSQLPAQPAVLSANCLPFAYGPKPVLRSGRTCTEFNKAFLNWIWLAALVLYIGALFAVDVAANGPFPLRWLEATAAVAYPVISMLLVPTNVYDAVLRRRRDTTRTIGLRDRRDVGLASVGCCHSFTMFFGQDATSFSLSNR